MRIRPPLSKKLKEVAISSCGLLILFAIAEVTVVILFPNASYIVRPSVLLRNYQLIFTCTMGQHVLGTFLRTITGFVGASLLGVTCGVLLARSRKLSLVFQPLVNLLRPIPSSILIPLLLLIPLFGFSELTLYFTVLFGGLWPILISTADGVRYPHPTAIDVIRQLQLSRFDKLRYFTLPQASSQIFSGMKISLSICLILSVTAELFVGIETWGLGYYQDLMGKDANYILMYMITLVVAVLGLVLNFLFSRIEFLHPWLKYKTDEMQNRGEK